MAEPMHDVAAKFGGACPLSRQEERPRTFAMALDEPRLDEQLEMPRNPRLRLAEDGHELRHGQLGFGQKGEQPQTRVFPGCLEGSQRVGKGCGRMRHDQNDDIKISLYAQAVSAEHAAVSHVAAGRRASMQPHGPSNGFDAFGFGVYTPRPSR